MHVCIAWVSAMSHAMICTVKPLTEASGLTKCGKQVFREIAGATDAR